jgi:hypothetical protein
MGMATVAAGESWAGLPHAAPHHTAPPPAAPRASREALPTPHSTPRRRVPTARVALAVGAHAARGQCVHRQPAHRSSISEPPQPNPTIGKNVEPTLNADAAKVTVPPAYSDRAPAAGTTGCREGSFTARGAYATVTACWRGFGATCSGGWGQFSVRHPASQSVRDSVHDIVGVYGSMH